MSSPIVFKKNKNFLKETLKSFNAAVIGFILVMRTQRNMRYHFLAALFIIILSIILKVTRIELMILAITITLVLVAEMVNTVAENIINIVKTKYHPLAKLVKDISAAAVLTTAINAVIIGYTVFSAKLPIDIANSIERLRNSSMHITFMSLILVFGLVVLGKVLFHRGTPLRGGMPSGHSALAFSMWTVIVLLTKDVLVSILALFMAFLIARSRVHRKIHSFWEVCAGAVLGVLVTLFIFQLIWRG
jgi:diacylglycerol kinase (ATP)